jgi:hypothetical protein
LLRIQRVLVNHHFFGGLLTVFNKQKYLALIIFEFVLFIPDTLKIVAVVIGTERVLFIVSLSEDSLTIRPLSHGHKDQLLILSLRLLEFALAHF